MNSVKYNTNEQGQPIEVILPFKRYKDLVDFQSTYEEKLRILTSIKNGAEEILRDRVENNLNQELSEFIDEIESYSHLPFIPKAIKRRFMIKRSLSC